ncbi:MAG: LTA synthase family protein [Opitutae bacterium]|nr:LTA synthase family protein [Opitutae bacterium]
MSHLRRIYRCLKNFFGPVFPIFATICLNMALLSIWRVGLSLWQFDRVSAIGAGAWPQLIFSGIRVDFASMGWLMLVPAVISALFLAENALGRAWNYVLRVILAGGTTFFFFMELATPSFVAEYGFRPNRLFFEYLVSPREIFTMLINGHLLELIVAVVFTIVAAFLFWKFTGRVYRGLVFPKRLWLRPIYATIAGLLLFAGARSTFDHRPLNPSTVAFAPDALVNSLAINSGYSVINAAMQMTDEENSAKIYGKMTLGEVVARVRRMRGLPDSDYDSDDEPTLSFHKATAELAHPKNVVIILLESHGAQFVGALGGLPLSPNMDKLADESWFFERCFATGTRSVRGIEAVITGFTPTPARSVVKLGKSQHGFFTIADLLADRGYHTAFIYGGEKHFDNMASFFYGNNVEEIIDEKDYPNPIFTGSWGVCDEDLFAMANKKFSEWHSAKTPFFSLVFTSSNHDPYEYPDGRIEGYDKKKQTRNNAAKYADYALGKFFETAKKSEYWNDTVFLVVADHDSRTAGAALVPIKNFHIPAMILGGGIAAKRDPQLISQIDLPTTLLSLAGIDAEYPMLGFDLTWESPNRAMMIYDKNFALMRGNNVAILMPGKPAQGFEYNFETKELAPAEITEDAAKDALAMVMWGTYAYNLNLFRATEVSTSQVRRRDERERERESVSGAGEGESGALR